jgi:hypothetical protein
MQSHSEPGDEEILVHIFHLLSQPLTALHCSLELALITGGDLHDYRRSIESALENADRLRSRLLLAREMAEAYERSDVEDYGCFLDIAGCY